MHQQHKCPYVDSNSSVFVNNTKLNLGGSPFFPTHTVHMSVLSLRSTFVCVMWVCAIKGKEWGHRLLPQRLSAQGLLEYKRSLSSPCVECSVLHYNESETECRGGNAKRPQQLLLIRRKEFHFTAQMNSTPETLHLPFLFLDNYCSLMRHIIHTLKIYANIIFTITFSLRQDLPEKKINTSFPILLFVKSVK